MGTGIGLADAKHIAETYGGGIQILSRPTTAFNENDPNYYNQPFITNASICFPIARDLQ